MIGAVDGDVEFVVEDFGESELANKLGVTQYPAIFIDDVLVATPRDFYGWGLESPGRYMPWREQASRDRFVEDFKRMLKLRLNHGELEARAIDPANHREVASLPPFKVIGLQDQEIDTTVLKGKVVVVEFFASWCPPCKPTLKWLDRLAGRHEEGVVVLALALQSAEEEVRDLVAGGQHAQVAMATTETSDKFGGVLAVPTLMIFDREGRTQATFYGAPPDLEKQVGLHVDQLLEGS